MPAIRKPAAQSPPPLDWPADALEVGRIIEGWGLQGDFRVQPYSADPQALLTCRGWHLLPPERARIVAAGALALPSSLHITRIRPHGEGLVAAAEGVRDRTEADRLAGARIFIARSSFPRVRADEYYWADLVGLAVVNRDGIALGSVAGLVETGPQTVLRVHSGEGSDERLIPFVDAYVDAVDLPAGRIVVDWALDY